jgi:hypothetical protein
MADRVAGIGEYGILLLGFDDGATDLEQPVQRREGAKLIFVRPYDATGISIKSWIADTNDPLYGRPETYEVTMRVVNKTGSDQKKNVIVHHSRVLHIAEHVDTDPCIGTPRLRPIFNRLLDLKKILSGSPEMFWKGGYQGIAFVADPEVDLDDDDIDDIKDELKEWSNSLSRNIALQGGELQTLAPAISDPTNHVKVQLQIISASTGIPMRLLIGSEQAELASSQDRINWLERVQERRNNFVVPYILEPFIQKLINAGVLPHVDLGSNIEVGWDQPDILSAKERGEIAQLNADALNKYAQGFAEEYIPIEHFLRSPSFLGLPESEVDEIMAQRAEMQENDIIDEATQE